MRRVARRKAARIGDLSYANLSEFHLKEIRNRLARIEGHVRALGRQMAGGVDCHDLLLQAAAVRSALSGLMVRLLEAHIDTCVKTCAREGRGDDALESVKRVLATALKQT